MDQAVSASGTVLWNAEQVAYQRWLSTPRRLREPKTQKLLATALGVHSTTLYRWTQLPGWEDAVREEIRTSVFRSSGVMLKVIESLVEQAQGGSFPHQRLYLEMAGLYNPKGAPEVGIKLIMGVDPEDI